MAIPQLKIMGSIFRGSSFGDDQTGIFRGRRRPDDPGDVTGVTWDIDEDFISDTLNPALWESGTTGTGVVSVSEGLVKLFTPADGDYAQIYGLQNWNLNNVNQIEFQTRVKPTLHADADNQLAIGVTGDISDWARDDCFFVSLASTSDVNDINCQTEKDNVKTNTDSALTNGVWSTIKIIIKGTSVKYYVNNVLQATHTTNIPDDIGLFPFIRMFNSDATPEDYQVEIDWIRVKIT